MRRSPLDSESFVAAVVQAAPVFLDRERSVEKAVALIEEAANEGASLVAFPEAWIPGYPSWIYHAAGWNEPRSKRTFARLQRNAVQVPGSATDALCRAAREAGVHLVVGISELDGEFSAGTIYNSLLFVSDEGAILGVHRKLVPTHAERIVWGRGDGSTLHVFDTRLGRHRTRRRMGGRAGRRRGGDRLRRDRPRSDCRGTAGARRSRALQPPRRLQADGRRAPAAARRLAARRRSAGADSRG